MGLKHKLSHDKDRATLSFEGGIDEDSQLLKIEVATTQELTIDFENLEKINSCGIRDWIKWIDRHQHISKIIFVNCHKFIIDQVNMIKNFLPSNGVVQSFYVPYYSESTDNERFILFRSGEEFIGKQINPPTILDSDQQTEMEMDINEEKYFYFLNHPPGKN